MAIFVTGSTGYLGSYLVAGLLRNYQDSLNLLVRAKTEQEEHMATQPGRVRAIPEGYHTVTPHLVIRGAEPAIEFYKNWNFQFQPRLCAGG